MAIGAFFDLDLTLLSVNSGASWVHRERRLGRISNRQMGQAYLRFILYRLSLIDMDEAMRLALAQYKGMAEQTLDDETTAWYEAEIAATAAPGAWPVLEEHRGKGHQLVLLTTSSPYESAAAKKQFGLDHALSSRYEVADGLLTGEFIPPLCYGPGKVTVAERHAAEHGIDLDVSYFYSDSYSDHPMLERVGHPFAVNPDLRLKRYAKKKGWPILDWR